MPPERLVPGDDGYETRYDKWVLEGSPSGCFERIGSFGGERWLVHDRANADGPTFLLDAAAGPTSTGYNETMEAFKSAEWPGPTTGYEVEMKDAGLRFLEGPGGPGDLIIKVRRQPRDTTV